MQDDHTTVISEVAPDLSVPPHVLPILMELFAGERQQARSLPEQLIPHLAACQYCRTAVVVLLGIAQEYDYNNNDPAEPTQDLLMHFTRINLAIEAYEYERLGAYAEAIVAEGQDKADLRFPDAAVCLKTCPDYRSALEATVAFIAESVEAS